MTQEIRIQQFLQVYRITLNPNTESAMSPADLIFARKAKSVFDRLLPEKKMDIKLKTDTVTYFNPGENIFFKFHEKKKEPWEEGVITKRFSRVLYMIKSSRWVIKLHLTN